MTRKQRFIFNKEKGLYWKVTDCDLWRSVKDSTKYSMSQRDTEAITYVIGELEKKFGIGIFEVHTYEVVPKQFIKVIE